MIGRLLTYQTNYRNVENYLLSFWGVLSPADFPIATGFLIGSGRPAEFDLSGGAGCGVGCGVGFDDSDSFSDIVTPHG